MDDKEPPSLDHIQEVKDTEDEQTEPEMAFDVIDAAADRRKLDRVLDILAIVARSRKMGCGSFPLSDEAEEDVSRMVSAAVGWAERYFNSDLPLTEQFE